MASIEFQNIGTNSFEARVTNLPTGYDKDLFWYLGSELIFWTSVLSGKDESNWLEFINLKPATKYYLTVIVKKFGNSEGDPVDGAADFVETKAEGGGGGSDEEEDQEWSKVPTDLGSLSNDITKTQKIDSYEIWRLKMSFDNSGLANFFSENASGIYGFLTTSTSLNETTGKPDGTILESDSSKSGNFSFEYEVSSGTTYYLYVRHYDDTDSGDITVVIEPPAGTSSNRPDKFAWKDGTKEKSSGKPFDITAKEWGNLLDNINAVREYKEYPEIGTTTIPNSEIEKFYYPKSNDTFYATYYNQCLHAFKTMGIITNTQYKKYTVEPKDPITADAINFLVKTINSVE